MDGWGWGGYGCVGNVPCMPTYAHTHTHTHTHICMLNMINMDASMLMAICNFYTCIHVLACMCVHVCVNMYEDTPHVSRHPPPTCPLPRAAGSQKPQNSKSPELIEIIRFCLKILYLWTLLNSYRLQLFTLDTLHLPALPHRADKTWIRKITSFERIKIQFCLKIWEPWTLLHTYRLGLMCSGGVLS